MLGLDYSRGAPRGSAVKAAGYDFVIRYCGQPGTAKNATVAEVNDMLAHGVAVCLVFEATAARAGQGYDAGVADAHKAAYHQLILGIPASRPIFYAVDYDADPATVEPYFRGLNSVAGPDSAYGGFRVVQRLRDDNLVVDTWQTVAWSAGKQDPRIDVFQRLGQVVVDGVTCDVNEARTADFGQYPIEEDPLSALSDQEQRDLYNRIMGFCRQRWYVIKNGQPVEVSADTPGAIAAHALDTLDGNYIVTEDEKLLAALKTLPAGGDVKSLAAALAPVLAPLLPAGSTPEQVGEAVVAALRAHPLAPAGA
jgi:hypothetical protein